MDVTCKNFEDILGVVSEDIRNASFFAIDAEMTGLSWPECNIHAFDTPEERYRKTRMVAKKFLVIQFGLAIFRFNSELNRYSVKVYNFYLFPRPFSRLAPDMRFTCQCSSLNFLANQGFDFNKVFREGIPYLLPLEEERLKESLSEKHALRDSQDNRLQVNTRTPNSLSPAYISPKTDDAYTPKEPRLVPDEQKELIESICSQVEEFLKSGESELHLKPCNGYQRKLTFQVIGQRFSGVHLETQSDAKNQRHIVVSAVSSPEVQKKKERERREAEFKEIDDALGFTKVIQMLVQSKKLIVGHNMLLDLLHIIDKFCHPLPEDYEEFKALASELFPRLMDTKVMGSGTPFKDKINNTALGDMQRILAQPPFSMPEIDQNQEMPNYKTENEKEHEAGYDAYVTGLCFLAMAKHLEPTLDKILTSPKIEQFMNKLFLLRILDIPYINLSGNDIKPQRDHVFYVKFPKEWKASDISQLFSPFGSVYIAWIDDTSVFVSLNRRDHAQSVMKMLPNTEYYQISRYADYMKRKVHAQDTATNNARQEKRKQPPLSDVNLPRKKRRSSQGSGQQNQTFQTISEEDENCEDKEEGEISNGTDTSPEYQLQADLYTEDIGQPVKRQRTVDDVKGEEKDLFEETDEWD